LFKRVGGLVAACVVVACGCGSDPADVNCAEVQSMSALEASWRRAVASDDEPGRRRVAGFAAKCGALNGQSRRWVRTAFGRPVEAGETTVYYYLGPDGLGIDSENLAIDFGADDRVISAEVVQF
jgi:hypothetical protein